MVSQTNRRRVARASALLSLIASPTRALILVTLGTKKQSSVQALADEIDMTHSAVSHQLAVLLRAKIVDSRKDGRITHYSVGGSTEAKALSRLLSSLVSK